MTNVGRHALFVTPAFFGYERDIVAELERQGYRTTFIDERPSNNAIIRALCRFRKDLIAGQIEKYYRAKFAEVRETRFDLVLVIKAEVIPRWFLEDLRRSNPSARFVYYTWDTLSNVGNCLDVLDCFDRLFSFDRNDVDSNTELTYLPLFYTREFAPLPAQSRDRRWSMSFVGTLHSERYAFVKRLFADQVDTYGFFYVQARWYFLVVKYLTREHRTVPWSDVSFTKLTREQVAQTFRESVAVLDTPRRGQAGLTMRTFEVLASGSVLITTNEAIMSEPFFDPERVIVVPVDWDGPRLKTALNRIDSVKTPDGGPKSFDRYSLESWVRAITTAPVHGVAD